MYILKTEHSFDAAHFLFGYEGKCSNIHGHRWRVVLEVQSEDLQADGQNKGMYVDFGDLKRDLREKVDYFDHSLIIEKGSLKPATLEALKSENFRIIELDFRPTAENFAKYFFDEMENLGLNVKEVTVYETPNNAAAYAGNV
jgi:6-pyruvoyltetrahydropterin/6-carboxytetrahydropterin synthase